MNTLFNDEERKKILNSPKQTFTYIILIITAISGLVCGIALLIPDLIFAYYLFIVVSGMMIYSYFTYAGICVENKNLMMFVVCIFVIIFTSILTRLISYSLVNDIL